MLVPTQQILKGGSGPPVDGYSSSDGGGQNENDKLEAGRRALKELLKKREKKKKKKNWKDVARLYITICGGLMLICGGMIFLFIIPMIIDPALVTLTFELTTEPVICQTTSYVVKEGLSNTSWCSCLEGCTSDVFRCYQILVSYKKLPTDQKRRKRRSIETESSKPEQVVSITNDSGMTDSEGQLFSRTIIPSINASREIIETVTSPLNNHFTNPHSLVENSSYYFDNFISDPPEDTYDIVNSSRQRRQVFFDDDFWDVNNAKLFVNVKGCGYPPIVNCSLFEIKYGKVGRRFYCHYSQVNNSVVLDKYDKNEAISQLGYAIGIPIAVIVMGALLVFCMRFPLQKRIKQALKKRKMKRKKTRVSQEPSRSSTELTLLSKPTTSGRRSSGPVFQKDWFEVHSLPEN